MYTCSSHDLVFEVMFIFTHGHREPIATHREPNSEYFPVDLSAVLFMDVIDCLGDIPVLAYSEEHWRSQLYTRGSSLLNNNTKEALVGRISDYILSVNISLIRAHA